jgi:hypothetical protein
LLVGALAALLRGGVAPLVRLVQRKPASGARMVAISALALLLAFVGLVIALSGEPSLDYGMPIALRASLAFNAIAAVLVFAAIVGLALQWRRLGAWMRVRESISMLAMAPAAFLFFYLGLAGFG